MDGKVLLPNLKGLPCDSSLGAAEDSKSIHLCPDTSGTTGPARTPGVHSLDL